MKKYLRKLFVVLSSAFILILCSISLTACKNAGDGYETTLGTIHNEIDHESGNQESDDTQQDNIVEKYSINENSFDGKTFPFIYVDVENNAEIESKENYLNCVIRVTNTDEEYVLDGENAKKAGIKGRGNSTWGMPKKPYTIKFESKENLLGFGKAKKFTLIANYCDKSLSRNLFAYNLAHVLGLDATTLAQPVNLVVNGDYRGVYLLCEQNEIGKNRVNIESDLSDIDTGYLLELDSRAESEGVIGVDFFALDRLYALKDPEAGDEGFTADHFEFIQSYVQDCYAAVNGDDFERVKELIDVNSFAKNYLVHELLNCTDVGYSSFYLYKNKGGKLFAGPLWDFDISSGNCDYHSDVNDYTFLWAKEHNPWYKKLLKFSEFNEIVAETLASYKNELKNEIKRTFDYQMDYVENNNANFDIWDILDEYVWPNPTELVEINTFQGQLEYLKTWLDNSLACLEDVYKM